MGPELNRQMQRRKAKPQQSSSHFWCRVRTSWCVVPTLPVVPSTEGGNPHHGRVSTQHGRGSAQHGRGSTQHGMGSTQHGRGSAQHGRACPQHGSTPRHPVSCGHRSGSGVTTSWFSCRARTPRSRLSERTAWVSSRQAAAPGAPDPILCPLLRSTSKRRNDT